MARSPILRLGAGLTVLALLAIGLGMTEPADVDLSRRLVSPSAQHPFGTDELGRDLFQRVLAGTAGTLRACLLSLALSLAAGIILGAWAGANAHRWPDRVFNWCSSLLFSVPAILLMAIPLSLGSRSLLTAYAALALVTWVYPARIVRAQVAALRESDLLVAAKAIGSSPLRIFIRIIIPQSVIPAFLTSAFALAELIGLEVGLSFIGVGVPPPLPSLGRLVADGLRNARAAWWLSLFPALTIFVLVVVTNSMARTARSAIERSTQ